MADEQTTLRRSDLHVLKALAKAPSRWVNASRLPNGNGHVTPKGGANHLTLRKLEDGALIKYGREPTQPLCGYRITAAGLAALKEHENV